MLEIVIANDDREDLFAIIQYKDSDYMADWAEVIYDSAKNKFILTVFTSPFGGNQLVFSLSEVQEALERAKQKLMQAGYGIGTKKLE